MLGGKLRSKPRCLIGFRASSSLIVDFANSVILWRHPGTGRASGSTLRRRLREWRDVALLPRVHAVLLRMTQSSPEAAARALDIAVDSCSVSAKRGGDGAGDGRGAGRGVSLPSHRGPDPIRIEL